MNRSQKILTVAALALFCAGVLLVTWANKVSKRAAQAEARAALAVQTARDEGIQLAELTERTVQKWEEENATNLNLITKWRTLFENSNALLKECAEAVGTLEADANKLRIERDAAFLRQARQAGDEEQERQRQLAISLVEAAKWRRYEKEAQAELEKLEKASVENRKQESLDKIAGELERLRRNQESERIDRDLENMSKELERRRK